MRPRSVVRVLAAERLCLGSSYRRVNGQAGIAAQLRHNASSLGRLLVTVGRRRTARLRVPRCHERLQPAPSTIHPAGADSPAYSSSEGITNAHSATIARPSDISTARDIVLIHGRTRHGVSEQCNTVLYIHPKAKAAKIVSNWFPQVRRYVSTASTLQLLLLSRPPPTKYSRCSLLPTNTNRAHRSHPGDNVKYCGSDSHFDARLSRTKRRPSGRMETAVLRVGAGRGGTGPPATREQGAATEDPTPNSGWALRRYRPPRSGRPS